MKTRNASVPFGLRQSGGPAGEELPPARAAAAGILAPITGRRMYRAWAHAAMVERLRRRSRERAGGALDAVGTEQASGMAGKATLL